MATWNDIESRTKKIVLTPLSFLYGAVVYVRNKLFDWNILKSVQFNIPVVSIGNIVAGNGYPRLRGVKGGLTYVHQTTQHNHSLPEIMTASGCAL